MFFYIFLYFLIQKVKQGTYKNQPIAAKSVFGLKNEDFAIFFREIKLLCTLDHENIIKTYGICIMNNEIW